MEIKRRASRRNEPVKTLVPEMEISHIRNVNEKCELQLSHVKDQDRDNVHHDYTIILTSEDIGEIMTAIFKQALKK